MFPVSSKKGGGGTSIAFPDVCKVPAPPAPFVPVPYPSSQVQDNLKKANMTDAKAKSGDKTAQKTQAKAIDNLKTQTGLTARSATQAVLIGRSVTGKPVRRTALFRNTR